MKARIYASFDYLELLVYKKPNAHTIYL